MSVTDDLFISQIRGPVVGGTGGAGPFTASYDSAQRVVEAHARYMEAVYRGNVYFAASQAAVTFSAGLTTTTAVGLILSNPIGSNKLLVPMQVEFVNTGVIVGVAGLSVMPYNATNVTHTTALTIQNCYVSGGNTPTGKADQGAALPVAPVAWKFLYSVLSTNTGVISQATVYNLDGSLILPAGTACAVLASAAITGFASLTWEEIPLPSAI